MKKGIDLDTNISFDTDNETNVSGVKSEFFLNNFSSL